MNNITCISINLISRVSVKEVKKRMKSHLIWKRLKWLRILVSSKANLRIQGTHQCLRAATWATTLMLERSSCPTLILEATHRKEQAVESLWKLKSRLNKVSNEVHLLQSKWQRRFMIALSKPRLKGTIGNKRKRKSLLKKILSHALSNQILQSRK